MIWNWVIFSSTSLAYEADFMFVTSQPVDINDFDLTKPA